MPRQRNGNKHVSKGSPNARSSHKPKRPPHIGHAVSKALRALWADPVRRAALLEKRKANQLRGPRPKEWSRFGIPDGMNREQAKWFWRQSKLEATLTMNKLEEAGVIPAADETPDADAARAALHYALTVMRGPVEQKLGLQAAGLVLTYTKAKPAQKQDITINKAEEWLNAVTADNGKEDTDEGAEGSS